MIGIRQAAAALALLLLAAPGSVTYGAPAASKKRIAFLVESWYPASHADVIGSRFLEGYRVGGTAYPAPFTIVSVFSNAPRPSDRTRQVADKYGIKVAGSIAEALLDDPRSARPRLIADGVLIATREDPPRTGGQLASPTPRLQTLREVMRILDQVGERVPIFVDKMLAGNWEDAQAIITEANRRSLPLMAGSVLPFAPLDRPVARPTSNTVAVVIASTPYWAFAFHAMELLQGYLEQRAAEETGIRSITEVGTGYWSLPDRARWGGPVFDTLLASARTRTRGSGSASAAPGSTVILIQYNDGSRGVLALVPRMFDDAEFLLGAQSGDGTIATGGVVLPGPPFDHFGPLVHAITEFFNTGRSPVSVYRTLLTTGIVLLAQDAASRQGALPPSLRSITYPTPNRNP